MKNRAFASQIQFSIFLRRKPIERELRMQCSSTPLLLLFVPSLSHLSLFFACEKCNESSLVTSYPLATRQIQSLRLELLCKFADLPFIHSYTHSYTHSYAHSLAHSLTHLHIRNCSVWPNRMKKKTRVKVLKNICAAGSHNSTYFSQCISALQLFNFAYKSANRLSY